MPVSTIFLGSIGVLAETSEIQRQAYNQALREAGVDWCWNRETYAALLEMSGGRERLRLLCDATGMRLSDATIASIHSRKTELACQQLRQEGILLRDGVSDLMALARQNGIKLGWVTSTYRANIDAIIDAAGGEIDIDQFEIIVSREQLRDGKPDPAAYNFALDAIGANSHDAIAFEDTFNSVLSAKRAGIKTIMIPGELTAEQDAHDADEHFNSLLDESGALRQQIVRLIACEQKGALSDAT